VTSEGGQRSQVGGDGLVARLVHLGKTREAPVQEEVSDISPQVQRGMPVRGTRVVSLVSVVAREGLS
jgi:hypothetical protein